MEGKALRKLIAQGEGVKLDFKREIRMDGLVELSKDFAAFANTEGGQILVGVTDDKKIVGAELSQEMQLRIHESARECKPSILLSIEEVPLGRMSVFAISIPKSTFIIADSRFRFPQRIGNVTVLMDFSMLYSLAQSKEMFPKESTFTSRGSRPDRKKLNKSHQYLFDKAGDANTAIAREALLDMENIEHAVAIEEHRNFTRLLENSLKNDDFAIRQSALNIILRTEYIVEKKRRESLFSNLTPIIVEIAINDKYPNVRNLALLALCSLGNSKSIDVILGAVVNDSIEAYQGLNPVNHVRLLVEKDLGHLLREGLYGTMERANNEETKRRVRELLATLRGIPWPG